MSAKMMSGNDNRMLFINIKCIYNNYKRAFIIQSLVLNANTLLIIYKLTWITTKIVVTSTRNSTTSSAAASNCDGDGEGVSGERTKEWDMTALSIMVTQHAMKVE